MGLSNATPTAWKKRGLTPKADTLAMIANYFGVTTDYLLGEETKKAPALTSKDERDIARNLEKIMADLENSGDLMFDGDPMSDEAKESIRSALKLGLEAAKLKNKQIYTPKKYRKG
ncbi:MAG: XRE family transcriptional regulator [Oscillospiraceae bacterium]|nr:XRE family transcriptional regulator [Oscillospiraceae bacterium]